MALGRAAEQMPPFSRGRIRPRPVTRFSVNWRPAEKKPSRFFGYIFRGFYEGKLYNKNVVDKIYTVSDDDAYFYTKELRTVENIFCGISAGANLKAAIEIAKEEENKNIVIIIPDKGDRYYSINI